MATPPTPPPEPTSNRALTIGSVVGVVVLGLCVIVGLAVYSFNRRVTVSPEAQAAFASAAAARQASSLSSPGPSAAAVVAEASQPVATPTVEAAVEPPTPTVELPTATSEPPTATPEPPTPVPVPGIGQEVTVEGMRWVVEEALDAGDRIEPESQFQDPATTSGKFIRVRVALQNNGTEPESVSTRDFELLDSQDRTFRATDDFEVMLILGSENRCSYEELPPGVPKVCRLVFEVPKDANGFRLKATNLALVFTEEVLIDLGF